MSSHGTKTSQGPSSFLAKGRQLRILPRATSGSFGSGAARRAHRRLPLRLERIRRSRTVAGKTVLTYPIPGVPGATATATLLAGTGDGPCARNCAERIEVRQGNVVTEFLYSDYEDYNEPLNKIKAFFPGHIVEKRDGVTILDLSIVETETGNLYVIMPVPESVRKASR